MFLSFLVHVTQRFLYKRVETNSQVKTADESTNFALPSPHDSKIFFLKRHKLART